MAEFSCRLLLDHFGSRVADQKAQSHAVGLGGATKRSLGHLCPPIQLQLDDLLTDHSYAWPIVGSPFTIAGGEIVYIRVESVEQAGVTEMRTWGVGERVGVRRANTKLDKP